jgi:hypothetical protein
MRVLRALRPALGTLLVGSLVGYVTAAFVGTLLLGSSFLGGTGEPPESRAYMLGLVQADPEILSELRPKRDVVSRAVELQTTQRTSGTFTPSSLTFLGGSSAGPLSVEIYVVGIRSIDGVERLIPFTLTLAGNKVVRIE